MKFFLKVKPGAKQERVEKLSPNIFAVWVKEPAKEGRANAAVIRLLAEYLGVAVSRVRIAHGTKSKEKVLEVE